MLASLCYGALRLSGLTALARRLSSGGVTLCYHNVVAARDGAAESGLGLHMPLPTFERQMRWLAANYDVISLDAVVDRISGGASLRGTAAVTFDDGYAGVFDNAWPLLQDLHIPATVFVVADAPGRDEAFAWDGTADPRPAWCRTASWRTISNAAAAGLRLGVHSATHRSLEALDEVDLPHELVESRDVIRERTGVKAEFFAYPFGRWSDRVRRAVRSAGYRAAFALQNGHHGAAPDLWALPRVNVPAAIGHEAFQAWTAGLQPRRRDA